MTTEKSAADWFARMHGPDAGDARHAFAQWSANPDNAAAYEHLVRAWDQSMFLANTSTGRARDLTPARSGGGYRSAAVLCAGVVLAIALGLVLIARLGAPDRRVEAGAVATEIASSGGGVRTIRLSDASRIMLDRSSRLEIAFTGTERRLRLVAGRARFDVAHDRARPFVVAAGGGSVIAHGTMFDIAVTSKQIDVMLLRGAVEVRDGSGARAPLHVRHLQPGQKVALFTAGISKPVAVTHTDVQWPQTMVEFEAVPLGTAVAAFNRIGGRTILVEDLAARRLRVTGAFRRDDPQGFADTLAATFGLTVRRNADATLSLVPGQSAAGSKKP
ncbi:FecR family protein [Sphingomonas sp.]|uniref:FecR family protein n=1 Tax=Sphingomonas sp. TaxID=28214 RepID=UPI003D6CDCBC